MLILILFVIWTLRPYLKTKNSKKPKDALDNILNSDQSSLRQPNAIFILIATITLLAFFLWLLPKFGINFLSLLQKIIPLISSLRGILPF